MTRYPLEILGTHDSATLLYTAPARADHIRTEEQFQGFKTLLDPYRNRPWIWIFDGAGMNMSHIADLGFCKRMYKLLHEEHRESLRAVWMLNTNRLLQGIVQLFPATKPVHVLPSDRLELLVTMQNAGVATATLDRLLHIVRSPVAKP